MDIRSKRRFLAILKVLEQSGKPMGSGAISRQLDNWGVELGERMVRYYLSLMDAQELTENLGRRGRVITEKGRGELAIGIAIDKVGFVAARIDALAYRMDFDERSRCGSVILNISLVESEFLTKARAEIEAVMKAGLGMGRWMAIAGAGEEHLGMVTPPGHIAIGTVCSVTLNGVLLRHGISMSSRFGGLLEFHEKVPFRFSQFINYDGSTLDPLEIFIKGRMTSVRQTALTGTGTIGASFREVPTATLPDVERIVAELEGMGLGGVLLMGKPNQPLLDIPVSQGRVGMIIAGGLNPVAALEEIGISTQSWALHSLCDFGRLELVGAG